MSIPTTSPPQVHYDATGYKTGVSLGAIIGGILLRKISQKRLQKSFAFSLLLLDLGIILTVICQMLDVGTVNRGKKHAHFKYTIFVTLIVGL